MILVDTSIWVNHFRHTSSRLVALLEEDRVLVHPCVLGELALSGLTRREEIMGLLEALPTAVEASHDEVRAAVSRRHLDGRGIGWVHAHLLVSALMSRASLWTADRKLEAAWADAGAGRA